MMRQHDAAGAHANGFGAAGDVAYDNRRGGAGDARHVVMLGEPVALVTQAFRMLREFERVAQCHGRGRALGDGRKIENRKSDHVNWREPSGPKKSELRTGGTIPGAKIPILINATD